MEQLVTYDGALRVRIQLRERWRKQNDRRVQSERGGLCDAGRRTELRVRRDSESQHIDVVGETDNRAGVPQLAKADHAGGKPAETRQHAGEQQPEEQGDRNGRAARRSDARHRRRSGVSRGERDVRRRHLGYGGRSEEWQCEACDGDSAPPGESNTGARNPAEHLGHRGCGHHDGDLRAVDKDGREDRIHHSASSMSRRSSSRSSSVKRRSDTR